MAVTQYSFWSRTENQEVLNGSGQYVYKDMPVGDLHIVSPHNSKAMLCNASKTKPGKTYAKRPENRPMCPQCEERYRNSPEFKRWEDGAQAFPHTTHNPPTEEKHDKPTKEGTQAGKGKVTKRPTSRKPGKKNEARHAGKSKAKASSHKRKAR